MEKYLITGFSGFVSKHFLDFLDCQTDPAIVLGIDINLPLFEIENFNNIECTFEQVDLKDNKQVSDIISDFRPTFVLHLASYSSVAYSWRNPLESFSNNTNIFLNLLEAIRVLNLPCRVLSIGSSEEYGDVTDTDIPLTEEYHLKPVSPYAVARVSQEMLSKVYVDGFGLDIIMTRSFNHIGSGQSDRFVISSFAKQLVLSSNMKEQGVATLITGDTSIIRDFVDVRDVVRAYYLLLKYGIKGEIYNICSGEGVSLTEIISRMGTLLNIKVITSIDPDLVRPSDNKVIIGSCNKITNEIGWMPEFTLDESLKDIIQYWRTNENFI